MARRPIAANLVDDDDQITDQGGDDQRELAAGEIQDDVEEIEDDVEELEDDLADTGGVQEPPEPRQRRATPRVREPDADAALIARVEAAERRAEAAERTAREASERYQQRQEPVDTPEQEAAKLALMTPYEQLQYSQRKIDKALANHDQRVQRGVLQAANASDKATFESFVSDKPQLKKIAAQVEVKHAELLAQGATPSRMDVAKYMLGELALKASQTPAARAADVARRGRVERQQTRPGTANSDVRGQPRRGGQTLEDRLANVQI